MFDTKPRYHDYIEPGVTGQTMPTQVSRSRPTQAYALIERHGIQSGNNIRSILDLYKNNRFPAFCYDVYFRTTGISTGDVSSRQYLIATNPQIHSRKEFRKQSRSVRISFTLHISRLILQNAYGFALKFSVAAFAFWAKSSAYCPRSVISKLP